MYPRGCLSATLRGETTKSRKTRVVPIATTRLRAVFEWLRLEADGEKKAEDALVFTDEAGDSRTCRWQQDASNEDWGKDPAPQFPASACRWDAKHGRYSDRNACQGSIRVARRAGT
jgi:hypothetical protein